MTQANAMQAVMADTCPHCGDANITGGHVETGRGKAHQTVTCDTCGAEWVEVYTLSRVVAS